MLWRVVYCLATWMLLPFVLLFFAWRARREPDYARHWSERLGLIERRHGAPIWVHAASVGEVVLVAPLVDALRARFPQCPLLVTTMTPTGRAQARQRFGKEGVTYCYLPLDTLGATRRFFARAEPRLGVIAETELWPNLIAAAGRARVPLALVNASLSIRSARRFGGWLLAPAMRSMLCRFAVIAAATESHARRFAKLGAAAGSVHVTGNLKYDVPDMESNRTKGADLRESWQADARPLWVAASTHSGEERLLIEAFDTLLQTHGQSLMVIAPRHPQRFDAVAGVLAGSGYRVARRSRDEKVDETVDIILADTLGEVPIFYAAADIVFVGGSLVPGIGGHNVIEAAALGCAVCVGPHIEEWRDEIEVLADAGGASVCDDPTALAQQVSRWLHAPEALSIAGQAAAGVAASHRGALDRSLRLITPLIAG